MVKIVEIFKRYKIYFAELFALALPLILGNLGQIFIGITNVYVAAKYSIDALAAVAIANAVIFTVFIVGVGLLMSISITLSNFRGSKTATKKYFNMSLLYTLALSVIFTIVTLSIIPLIDKLGFEPKLIPHIKEYMFISSFSFIGIYLYQGIREFLLAHEIVFFPNMVLLGAVAVNFVFNFAFVFGFGPIPAMGVVGLALSTLMVRTLMGLVLLFYCYKLVYSKKQIYKLNYVKKLFKVGYPIGIAMLVEFMAFNLITILVGRIDGLLSATHNIILNIVDATFMIPLALSSAMAIKIGFYNGARNYLEIKRYSIVGMSVSMIFMFCTSMIMLFFPKEIIVLFTDNKEILQIGVPILFVTAVFQIFDGLQVAASGVLKGLKMTKVVSQCVFGGYWLLGIPLGCILAYKYDYKLLGFWIGLAVSLFVISIILSTIIFFKFKQLKKEYS